MLCRAVPRPHFLSITHYNTTHSGIVVKLFCHTATKANEARGKLQGLVVKPGGAQKGMLEVHFGKR